MRKPTRTYPITLETLTAYQQAAMRNAAALLEEAQALFQGGHYARAYFLAEAAIEETGKAAIAHFAKGRNLTAPDVQARIRIEFEDHGAKIRAAFFAHVLKLKPEKVREELEQIVRYIRALQRGRESALYSDFRRDVTVYAPADVVKPEVARDCLLLAMECSIETAELVTSLLPESYSKANDKWYALGPKGLKVWQEDDFGEYLLDHIKKRGVTFSFSEAVTTYHDAYLRKGRKFRRTVEESGEVRDATSK
jgi:AbiV family abortive infection protein